jgi:hypothetical protein
VGVKVTLYDAVPALGMVLPDDQAKLPAGVEEPPVRVDAASV